MCRDGDDGRGASSIDGNVPLICGSVPFVRSDGASSDCAYVVLSNDDNVLPYADDRDNVDSDPSLCSPFL
jgi:hypothetical protein